MSVKLKFLRLTAALAFLLICGCDLIPQKQPELPNPRVVSPEKASKAAKSAPYSNSYTGLAFFQGKVYASSVIGLLEYENGKLSHLYQWRNRDDVTEDIAFDKANRSLWFFHARIIKLFRFDGKNWSLVDLPKIKGGYTRGDIGHGFQGFSTDSAFWLQGERGAWKWNPVENSWTEEPIPVKPCDVTVENAGKDMACYKSHAPLKSNVLVIMHGEYMSDYSEAYPHSRVTPKPLSDRVFFLQDEKWREIPNDSAVDFVTKDVVVAGDAAFVKTIYGKLFRVTTSEIAPIETIGEVEAMTVTTKGNLLVSFRHNGIYEYNENGWQKKFSSPYPPDEFEHFTELAESDGQIAFAISSKSDHGVFFKNYPGQTTLWISDGNELKVAPLGK